MHTLWLHSNKIKKMPAFPGYIWNRQYMMIQPHQASGTQPRKHMKTMGKFDTSDLMMIIFWWVITIYTRSPKFEWVSPSHKTPRIAKKIRKVIERTNHISDTLSTEYTQHTFMRTARMNYSTQIYSSYVASPAILENVWDCISQSLQ